VKRLGEAALREIIGRYAAEGLTAAEIESRVYELLKYAITRKLVDAETLDALRKGDWPDEVRQLLGGAQ